MYTPPEYQINNENKIDDFLAQNTFGILTASLGGKPIASHLPFVIEKENGKRVFYTHVANANDLSHLKNGDEILLIFQGEHGYVSSSWYASVNVPTWNYQAVHVYVSLERLTEEELYHQLKNLTAKYEKTVGGHIHPDELPPRMIGGYLQHITGFKLTEIKTEAQFKLSQNRHQKDFSLIIENLNKFNPKLAAVMVENYIPKED